MHFSSAILWITGDVQQRLLIGISVTVGASQANGGRNTKNSVTLLLASALFASGNVYAGNVSVYGGGSIALARNNGSVTSPQFGSTVPFGGHDIGFQVEAGLKIARYLGFELGYADLGSFSGVENYPMVPLPVCAGCVVPTSTSVKTHVYATTAFAVGVLPLGRWDLLVKAGAGHWNSNHIITDTGVQPGLPGNYFCTATDPGCHLPQARTTVSGTVEHGTAFAYGAGAAVHFGRCAIRAEYERFEFEGNPSLVLLGATWTFF